MEKKDEKLASLEAVFIKDSAICLLGVECGIGEYDTILLMNTFPHFYIPLLSIPGLINQFQNCMKKLVESNFFQRSILIAILLNTLSMGVEYHNQVSWCVW